MEVDIPKLSNGPHPFIIWVHGGGWVNGSANAFKKQSAYLASRGIAGVRITYSLISQGGHFDQGMQELADAFDFIKKHAVEWKLDITSFGYAGGSAGTPLAALTALKHNGNGCRLFIGCNGIYDFEDNLSGNFGSRPSPYLKKYSKKSDRGVISAINYIADKPQNIPAVAVFHGKADFTISYLQSVAFCDSIIKKGGHAEKYIYDLYVHSFFNRGASDMFEDVTMNMYTFAKSVFRMHDVIIPQQNNSAVIARSVNQ
jgi:acetyl esterase/lipase